MKKALVLSGVLVMLFAGCSSKSPTIDESQKGMAGEQVESAADADTIVIEDDGTLSSEGADAGEQTMSSLEKRMQTVYFAFDKFNISSEASEKLDANARLANGQASEFNIKIEGNCDEWGSDEYNFALGLKRAKAAKDVMIANGVDEKRISMVSYGESNPVCTAKTVDCWAENRRADFKLLP